MDHRVVSLADQVFEKLEKDILTEVYAPGEILSESRLSEDMKVSRTPIRDALVRLEEEHLLDVTSKGARVVGMNMQDIDDIYDIRMHIEGLAARKAAELATEEGLQAMRKCLDEQEFHISRQDHEGVQAMDSRFHSILYEICGSPILRYTLEPLHRKLIKYRQVSITVPNRAERSLKEHRGVYEAIARRNPDESEKRMVEHIRSAWDNIRQSTRK